MLRTRRYRGLLAFAAIFILAVIHFTSSREPSTVSLDIPPPHIDHPEPVSPIPPAADKQKEPAGSSPPPSQEVLPDAPTSQKSTDSNVSGSDSNPDASSQDQSASGSTPQEPEHPGPSSDTQKLTGVPLLFPGAHGQDALKVEPAPNPRPYWKKVPENFPVAPQDMIKLPAGRSKTLPKLQAKFRDETSTEKMKRVERLSTIRSAFEHAWSGYKASAMGHDELKPLRGGYRDTFNGWGATLVDTLDTLWIMDLKEEFSIAVDQVKKIDFTTTKSDNIPIFEVAIRYMGGLLGAYDISGHKYDVLLEKAVELGEILIGAFDTPNRMPILYYNWAPDYAAQQHHADEKAVLAELGSLSVELTRLAQLTKDNKYYDAIARITNELEQYQDKTTMPGLWPLQVDASGCRRTDNPPHPGNKRVGAPNPVHKPEAGPTDAESYKNLFENHQARGLPDNAEPAVYNNPVKETSPAKENIPTKENSPVKESIPKPKGKGIPAVTECTQGLTRPTSPTDKYGLGGQADSTYEYLPKEYMLLGGLNEQYRTMYEKAMNAAREHIIYQPMIKDVRNIRFSATVSVPKPGGSGKVSHSYEATHLACFAGGMVGIGAKLFGIEGDMDLAAKLTDGCVWAYESTKTGIMPEHFLVVPCDNDGPCVWNETAYWSTLDPNAEKRKNPALSVEGQKQEFARDSQDLTPGSETSASASVSATPAAGSYKPLGKRSPERGNWRVVTSPSSAPKPKSADADITDRDIKNLDRVSHEEFVSARIEREHLFPGAVSIPHRQYLLRPEAIESVFVMYRLTGNNYWREKGWKMFEAVAKYTRTELAHSDINDVTLENPQTQDRMQSFWLAETLKYFYLLFSDPSVVNLDEYVLNSEAHPLKRPEF